MSMCRLESPVPEQPIISRLGLTAVLLSTLLLAACGDSPAQDASPTAPAERHTPIAAVELQPRDLSRQLTLSATVEPRILIRLASRASGTVRTVRVEAGDSVTEGELLAELDTAEQEAELARARAHEEEARFNYQQLAQLRGDGSISAAEYQGARAALRVTESERQLWETRVAFGRITAPRDAVVTARYIEPGEAVDAQDTLFELTAMESLVLRPGVSELDVVHLRVGQTVPIRLDALPEHSFEGRIRRIYPTADRGSRLIPVEIALPEDAAGNGIRPGYLARIRMAIDERPEVLAVPAAALGEDDDGHFVYRIIDEQLEHRPVVTGVDRGQWTEVTEGLERGDVVLATDPIDLRPGQRVRIVSWRG